MARRLKETVGELKNGETKHPEIAEKNYDEAQGKRAEKRDTRVKPIGMLRQNAHILDRFIRILKISQLSWQPEENPVEAIWLPAKNFIRRFYDAIDNYSDDRRLSHKLR